MRKKFLSCYVEWFYGIESPRVIIEEFLLKVQMIISLGNIKLNGESKLIQVDTDRFTKHKMNFFNV